MTKRDPADLLPGQVTINLEDRATDATIQDVKDLLEFNTPEARIERLRRHDALAATADQLATKLPITDSPALHRLDAEISKAETKALYLDAAPAVIDRKKRTKNLKREETVSDEQILAVVNDPAYPTRAKQSEKLGISDRQIQKRLKKIGEL